MQDIAGEAVQHSSQEGLIGRDEPCSLAVALSFEDREPVTQSEDFGVLGPAAHGQQS